MSTDLDKSDLTSPTYRLARQVEERLERDEHAVSRWKLYGGIVAAIAFVAFTFGAYSVVTAKKSDVAAVKTEATARQDATDKRVDTLEADSRHAQEDVREVKAHVLNIERIVIKMAADSLSRRR